MMISDIRLLVMCTVSTGLDAVAEVIRRGGSIEAVIGLDPSFQGKENVSGFVDVAVFCSRYNVPFRYVKSYSLNESRDRGVFEELSYDLIWVAGWQRLVPQWLIESSQMGVVGGHGSPDGIHGGRGRSPQNWALMLGCERFDLALFRITPGIDEGPVVARRSFFYLPEDDIQISYYRASLMMAEMICDILVCPELVDSGVEQPAASFYYPQRKPEDGFIDWALPRDLIVKHCRSLTRPYPGLRTKLGSLTITLWKCQVFDDAIDAGVGEISFVFESGDFLVCCLDGRVLIRDWSASDQTWMPTPGDTFESLPFHSQISTIIQRHEKKYPDNPVSQRVKRWSGKE